MRDPRLNPAGIVASPVIDAGLSQATVPEKARFSKALDENHAAALLHLGASGLQDVAHNLPADRHAVRGPETAGLRVQCERARHRGAQPGLARFEIGLERDRNNIARPETRGAQQLHTERELVTAVPAGKQCHAIDVAVEPQQRVDRPPRAAPRGLRARISSGRNVVTVGGSPAAVAQPRSASDRSTMRPRGCVRIIVVEITSACRGL